MKKINIVPNHLVDSLVHFKLFYEENIKTFLNHGGHFIVFYYRIYVSQDEEKSIFLQPYDEKFSGFSAILFYIGESANKR